MIFWNEKTPFYATKRRSSKSQKIDIFSKRITHGFDTKMAIFPTFFLRQYRLGKCILWYSGTKKRLSRLQKEEVQKVENLTFFQRGQPMVFVQKWPFFHLCFFRQYRPWKFLLSYSRTKKTLFEALKTRSSKSRKISKNGHFSNLFLSGTIGQENVFYDIVERINAFLGYKNKKFKKFKKVEKLSFFQRG